MIFVGLGQAFIVGEGRSEWVCPKGAKKKGGDWLPWLMTVNYGGLRTNHVSVLSKFISCTSRASEYDEMVNDKVLVWRRRASVCHCV